MDIFVTGLSASARAQLAPMDHICMVVWLLQPASRPGLAATAGTEQRRHGRAGAASRLGLALCRKCRRGPGRGCPPGAASGRSAMRRACPGRAVARWLAFAMEAQLHPRGGSALVAPGFAKKNIRGVVGAGRAGFSSRLATHPEPVATVSSEPHPPHLQLFRGLFREFVGHQLFSVSFPACLFAFRVGCASAVRAWQPGSEFITQQRGSYPGFEPAACA